MSGSNWMSDIESCILNSRAICKRYKDGIEEDCESLKVSLWLTAYDKELKIF